MYRAPRLTPAFCSEKKQYVQIPGEQRKYNIPTSSNTVVLSTGLNLKKDNKTG